MHRRSISCGDDTDIPLSDLSWDEHDASSRLGEGSFGRVVKGYMHGEEVAIKIVRRYGNAANNGANGGDGGERRLKGAVRQHEREWHRLRELTFATIVQFFGVARRGNGHGGDLMIVTEFMRGGSLNESLVMLRRRSLLLREESFLRIAWQVSNGLRYVHSRELTHGDIKPHNILLTNPVEVRNKQGWFEDDNWKAKLADFGLSMRLRRSVDDTSDTADFGQGAVGTFLYMAPEAYKNYQALDASDAKAVDVYALGIVLQEMLTGRQPWVSEDVKSRFALYDRVCVRRERPKWGEGRCRIPPDYIRVVDRCMRHDPKERPTARELSSFFAKRFTDTRSKNAVPKTVSPVYATDQGDAAKMCVSVMNEEQGEELAIIQHVESRPIVNPDDGDENESGKKNSSWSNRPTLSTNTGTEIDSSALSQTPQPASSPSTGDESTVRATETQQDGTNEYGFTGAMDSVAGLYMRRVVTGVPVKQPSMPDINLPGFGPGGSRFTPLLGSQESRPVPKEEMGIVEEGYKVYVPHKGSDVTGGETALGASTAVEVEDTNKIFEGNLEGMARLDVVPANNPFDSFINAANGGTPGIPGMDLDIRNQSPVRSQDELLKSFAAGIDPSAMEGDEKSSPGIETSPTGSMSARSRKSAGVTPKPGSRIKDRISMFENNLKELSPREKAKSKRKEQANGSSVFVSKSQGYQTSKENSGDTLQRGKLSVIMENKQSVISPKHDRSASTHLKLSGVSSEDEEEEHVIKLEDHEKSGSLSPVTVAAVTGSPSKTETSSCSKDKTSARTSPNPAAISAPAIAESSLKTEIGDSSASQPNLRRAVSRLYNPGHWEESELDIAVKDFEAYDLSKVTTASSSATPPSKDFCIRSKKTTATSRVPGSTPKPISAPITTTHSPSSSTSNDAASSSGSIAKSTHSLPAKTPSPPASYRPPSVERSRVEKCIKMLETSVTNPKGLEMVRKELSYLPTLVESEYSFTDPSIPPCDCSDTIRARRAKLIASLTEAVCPCVDLLLKQDSTLDVQLAMMSIRALLEVGASHGIGPSLAARVAQVGTWTKLILHVERRIVAKAPLEMLCCVLALIGQLVACGKSQLSANYDFPRILSFLGAILDTCLYRYYYNQNQYSWMAAAHCAVSIMTVIGERATDRAECSKLRASSDDVNKRYFGHPHVYGNEIIAIVTRLRNAEWKGYDRMGGTPVINERRPSAP